MCPHCRAFITSDDKVCPYCDAPVGPRAIDRRSPPDIAGGLIPHARFTTTLILLINSGLYVATVVYSMNVGRGDLMSPDGRVLDLFGAMWSPAIHHGGEWWRLITAGFLHGGLLHILMNSWVLFDLGAQTEEFYGTSRMIVIYFMATIGGFYASSLRVGLSVGASAGLFGLIGAMIAFGMTDKSAIASAMKSFYIRWAVYGMAIGFLIPVIDWRAHVGGIIAGFAVGYIAGTPKLTGRGDTFWKGAATVCVVLTLFAFAIMFLRLLSVNASRG
jgi:rhomboid protease GluP